MPPTRRGAWPRHMCVAKPRLQPCVKSHEDRAGVVGCCCGAAGRPPINQSNRFSLNCDFSLSCLLLHDRTGRVTAHTTVPHLHALGGAFIPHLRT